MKYYNICFILFFCLSPFFLDAQCVSGNCRDGSGIYIYPSGNKYVGQFTNGRITGIGTCYYTDGSKYQGEWLNGLPEGKGVKVFVDGRKISGNWKRGELVKEKEEIAKGAAEGQSGCVSGDCRNGKGIYIYSSGAVYIGEFKDGIIHGVGVCNYSDGSKYQGQWVDRLPEGIGTRTYADGKIRNGMWKAGLPVDEYGTILDEYITENDPIGYGFEMQTGCISGNCDDGRGTFAYPNGSKYEGTFKDGQPNGSGIYTYPNGEKYVGIFRNGFQHGKGKLYREDEVVEGVWEEGEYVGKSTKEIKESGCLSGDCINGFGTFAFRDGAKYSGSFRNKTQNGKGTIVYANGDKYTGDWKDGIYDGEGTLYLQNGAKVSGLWRQGVYAGLVRDKIKDNPIINLNSSKSKLKVWAVIIGVASYNHMPVLRYTDDDAYRMYAFLKSPEGGALEDDQISILIDEAATKQNIINTMNKIFGKAGPNDLVMLYFSGHGLKGSFLPSDFDGFNNKLEHEEINAILKNSPAKYKLCIADACHSGSLLAMKSGQVPNTLANYYQSLAQAQRGTALIMSSKSDETSLESSGLRQGVFSHFLIRGLKGEADFNTDKVVTVQELFNFVSSNVKSYTNHRQSPLIKGDYDKNMTVAVRR
jgi:hypothetical protein